MLVDLFTLSREFEDLMLTEYEGLIFEDMHKVDDTGEERTYCFYNLDYRDILRFIGKHEVREKYEFEIRNKKGEVVEVNKL